MELKAVLEKLSQVRGGPEHFTARCPAHDDHHNSLSITQAANGRILLYCHAGCSITQITDKIGFTLADMAPRAHSEIKMQNCKKTETPPETDKEKIYKYYDASNNLLFEVVRRFPKQFFQRRYEKGEVIYNLNGITPVLYRLPELLQQIKEKNATVFLCEGEKDADRLATLGFLATTAPMGAGKWHDTYTESLRGAARVVLFPDHDKAGYNHVLTIASKLDAIGISVEICDLQKIWPDLPEKGDVSDLLDALGNAVATSFFSNTLSLSLFKQQYASITQDKPSYQFTPVNTFLRTHFLDSIAQTAGQAKISTGFAALDTQLEGQLYAGLYVIGSVSSLGKTAFCLQMADFIAASGHDVLFYTLEMSREEMIARSLTRIHFIQNNFTHAISMGALLRGTLSTEALDPLLQAYECGPGGHIAFLEGEGSGVSMETITTTALLHKKTTGRNPVVFVDYLQIIRPADVRMSDKQAMDMHVSALKRLSRELCAPVIAISSFNRQNYSEAVNLSSFKESGAIEYSADFVLGLQAQGVSTAAESPDEKRAARLITAVTQAAKQKEPRPLEAITLKNRRGPAFAHFSLDFYPKANLFVST